jgi:hypothetical protein
VKKTAEQSVAFHELFSFADPLDWLLMAAGSAGAIVHGAAMPVFFLLFGELVNGFGKNQHHLRRMTDEVSKARISSTCPASKSLSVLSVAVFVLANVTDAQSCCSTRSTSSTSASSSAHPHTLVGVRPNPLTPAARILAAIAA